MNPHSKIIPLRLHPLGFIEAFTQLGVKLEALLYNTGIDRDMLDNRNAKISYIQQRILIKNGIDLSRKPGVGLLVGQRFDWSYYGTVGLVVHCSPSLREAGEAFHRFLMIAQPVYAMYPREPLAYVREKGLLIYPLRCLPTGESDKALVMFEREFTLALTLRFWDICGNKSVADPSVRVYLQSPEPAHVDPYRALPCTSIEFGCEQSYVAAHPSFVVEPFRPFRRHAFECLIEQCEEELGRTNLETSYTAKVRWHIYTHWLKRISLEKVAEILDMTPRTLARRLAAENTTFRTIVHEVRMELTSYHLRYSRLSVDEIAELMGFSCASSLRRAIKNWTGGPAGTVRPAPDVARSKSA